MDRQGERKIVVLLFVLGLLIRVIFITQLEERHYWIMSSDYFELGKNVALGKGFTLNNQPVLFYEPGYSLFLSLIYLVFGQLSLFLVRLISSVINCLNCLLIYKIAKEIFPNNPLVAPLSFLLAIFYPLLIFIAGDAFETTLFSFFISLVVWQLLHLLRTDKLFFAILAGVSFGLTALVKPTVIPFFIFSLFWLSLISQGSVRHKIGRSIIISITAIVIILPWTLRNYKVSGQVIIFATKGGFNFWLGNNPKATASSADKGPALVNLREFLNPYFPHKDLSNPFSLSPLLFDGKTEGLLYSSAIAYIRQDPIHYALLAVQKGLYLWRFYPTTSLKNEFSTPFVKTINIISYGPILFLGIIGMILSYRQRRQTSLIVLLLLSFTIVHALFFPKVRFRIPLDPYLIIFSSYSLIFLRNLIQNVHGLGATKDHEN